MKKLKFLIAITICSLSAFAQSSRSGTLLMYNGRGVKETKDTLTNTDTVYMWNGRNDMNQWNVALQYYTTQLTGTITPTTIVQGSNNATSITTGTWYTLSNCTLCQTLGLSDTGKARTTVYDFLLPANNFRFIRVAQFQTGTGTSIPTGLFWLSAKFTTKGL